MSTIKNSIDLALQGSTVRSLSTDVAYSGSGGSSFTNTSGVITPANIAITAVTTGFTSAHTTTWKYKSSSSSTWNTLTVTQGTVSGAQSDTLTVSSAQYAATIGTGSFVSYRSTTSQYLYPNAVGEYNIYYSIVGSGYTLNILNGVRAITYLADGTTPSPTQTAFSSSLYQNGTLVTPSTYIWSATGVLSGTSSIATFTPTVAVYSTTTASTVSLTVTYTDGVPVTQTIPITISKPGAEGSKSITISAFQWATSLPAHTQAFTYTWSSGVASAYPLGWTPAAPISPASGYTLYQINLIITALQSAITTDVNWSIATVNTIGYRLDGSIGPQGDPGSTGSTGAIGNSAKRAYALYANGGFQYSTPTSTTSGADSAPPNNTWGSYPSQQVTAWTQTVQVPGTGQALYQTDGLYNNTSITWQPPYLSNFKVGSLQALSANLGSVEVAASGSLYSTGKTYGTSTAGFFLGYSSSTAKFDCTSSATSYLRWNGSTFEIAGGTIGGTTSIDVTGSCKVEGNISVSAVGGVTVSGTLMASACSLFNNTGNQQIGVLGKSAQVTGAGVYGEFSGTNGSGVFGYGNLNAIIGRSYGSGGVGVVGQGIAANTTGVRGDSGGSTGIGVHANGTPGGTALYVSAYAGTAPIVIAGSTTECTNLKASDSGKLNGQLASYYLAASGTAANSTYVQNRAIVGTITASYWGGIPEIEASVGLMEIGQYIDFHSVASLTPDYSVRLRADAGGGTTGTGDLYLYNGDNVSRGVPSMASVGSTGTIALLNTGPTGISNTSSKWAKVYIPGIGIAYMPYWQ